MYDLHMVGVTGHTLLHQDEEEQTIQHLQGGDRRNVHHDHHLEVLLVEKKMENTVAGLIPPAMKVQLLQTVTEMETLRLESKWDVVSYFLLLLRIASDFSCLGIDWSL